MPRLRRMLLLAPLLLLAACRHAGFPNYPDGYREFAYVSNRTGNTVTVLDLVYLRPDRTLAVGGSPVAEAVNPLRDEVYIVNAQPGQPTGSVSVIDTAANTVVATLPVHGNPSAIAVDPSGRRAFVVNTGSNSITVLDLETRRTIAVVATGARPNAAAVSPDGRTLLVTNGESSSASIFAAGSLPPLRGSEPAGNDAAPGASNRVPLTLRATFTGCPGAASPVILPDSSKAFVACAAGHQVMALQLASAPNSWPARQDPASLSDHVLALLDVGQNPAHLTLKPDGGEVFVSNLTSNTVSEILTQTNDVGSTYFIGNRPAHGLVNASNGALYVSNAGADSVSLYSIDEGKFLSSLRTGNAPDALAFSADEHLLLAADTGSGDVSIIRTNSQLGPALFTILPAGGSPSAIAVKAMPPKP